MAGYGILLMRKLFVDKVDIPTHVLTDEAHVHLSVVLRARKGDQVVLSCGDGKDYYFTVSSFNKQSTELKYEHSEINTCEPNVKVTSYVSLLKNDKFEWVVQKEVELGVDRIVPLVTRFVQVKSESLRLTRLNKIAAEAAEQSGRGKVPEIASAIGFEEMLNQLKDYDLVVFPYEKAKEVDIRSLLKGIRPSKVAVIVGSEGGFSQEECDMLIARGIQPITLGKRILRAETANIAVLSVLMYELGEMK